MRRDGFRAKWENDNVSIHIRLGRRMRLANRDVKSEVFASFNPHPPRKADETFIAYQKKVAA